jgi:hypothetical protein
MSQPTRKANRQRQSQHKGEQAKASADILLYLHLVLYDSKAYMSCVKKITSMLPKHYNKGLVSAYFLK